MLPTTPYDSLVAIVHNHLLNSADWHNLTTHSSSPRSLISGLPPLPVYTDPDADPYAPPSAEALQQREWVLPVSLRETMSPRMMAAVFDGMPAGVWGTDQKGVVRKKRLLLAVCAEDSTVVYYFVHDGIVKPRQN